MDPTHPHDARPADLTAVWSPLDYAARLAALRRHMDRLELGLCLLTAPANQAYFGGFRTIYYPRPVLLAVGRDSTALIVPACEEAEARATARVDAFVVYHEQPGLTGAASPLECVARTLDHVGRATGVGVEMDVCPVELATFVGARGCSLADIGPAALRIREVKAVSELERIAAAASITALAVGASVELMAAGVSELEVDEVGNAAAVAAAAALAAPTTLELFVITSSGTERTTFPHTLSTTRRLQPGDVVSHSRQVGLGGYRAEIERTLIVGPATTEQCRVFEAMRRAQAAAMEVVRPGVRCCDVDRAARRVLAGAGLDAHALHRSGHGLGLATEWPALRHDNEAPLEQGMVVTVEPGVYLPGLGGFRHSDTLVVTAGGADRLTAFPSTLADLTIPVPGVGGVAPVRIDLDRLFAPDPVARSGFAALPTVLAGAVVATSSPAATRAGVRALELGGNAVDAALAAAACLTVCEPTDNGLGGDAFSIVWIDGALHGINGSGRAPAALAEPVVEQYGPRSCTVPGAVRLWGDLADRFGRLGLDTALGPAIDLAERGVAATPRIADRWRLVAEAGRAPWRPPRVGERYTLPALGRTLRRIAELGPAGLYEGPVAEAIAAATWLGLDDLHAHRSEWVEPLRLAHRGLEVCELPPNGSGAAALMALGIYDGLERLDPLGRLHAQVESMRLAFADAYRYVSDAPLPPLLLDPEHLALRRAEVGPAADDHLASTVPGSDTTYLCCVDEDRNAVSHIQSLFESFGSGVLAGDTGVVLQNRAACFSPDPSHPNAIAPGKRPYHTIIPGMLLEGGRMLGPFGIMGGHMQPQAHLQVVSRLVDGLDPQAALDAARFRVEDGRRLALEPGLGVYAPQLRALGHDPYVDPSPHRFGVGQAILSYGEVLVAGSDLRADGQAAGY